MRGLTEAEYAMLDGMRHRATSTVEELPILDALAEARRVSFAPDPPGTGYLGEHTRTDLGRLACRLWPATRHR